MTPREMRKEIDDCGPDITDQQRLKISIMHWKSIRDLDIMSIKGGTNNHPVPGNCALCDKYFESRCSRLKTCLLGKEGCISIYKKARGSILTNDKPAFMQAADEMIEFLEGFLEKEDDVLEMRYRPGRGERRAEIKFKPGVLLASSKHNESEKLLALTIHHFNAFERIKVKLEERKAALEKGKDPSESLLISKLLAICEEPKQIKVGDTVRADEVPIGAMVEVDPCVHPHTKRVRKRDIGDSDVSIWFNCVACPGGEWTKVATQCKILELPTKTA